MNFGHAIDEMKTGKQVYRDGWNGVGIYCAIETPNERTRMTQPYIYIDTRSLETTNPEAPKGLVPWLASQTDMLAGVAEQSIEVTEKFEGFHFNPLI